MPKKDDPDLAPDAALAEDLGDEDERQDKQREYFGGEKDDIDDFDPAGLDDGSDPEYVAPDPDEDPEAKDDADKDPEPDAKADGDKEESDDADDSDDEGGEEGGEEDAAEDADADESSEAEADPDPEQKVKGIPKRRFDEVNERRKAAEEELARRDAEKAAGEQAAEEVYDFDEAETEYMDLLLDGKTQDALAKRKEIRAAEKSDFQKETKEDVQSSQIQREVSQELDALSREAEKMFPVFDRDHDDFSPAITKKVMVYYHGYMEMGEENPGDAFVLALADVIDQYGLDGGDDPEPDPDPDPEPKPDGKKKDTAKKTEAAKQAHKPVAGEGAASDSHGAVVPNIEDMTDEELDALPEKTLARLRGDFVD